MRKIDNQKQKRITGECSWWWALRTWVCSPTLICGEPGAVVPTSVLLEEGRMETGSWAGWVGEPLSTCKMENDQEDVRYWTIASTDTFNIDKDKRSRRAQKLSGRNNWDVRGLSPSRLKTTEVGVWFNCVILCQLCLTCDPGATWNHSSCKHGSAWSCKLT